MSINVIIPLAGEGSRFKEKNFLKPKPLIKVFRNTLIEISIKSLNIKNANYFFITKKYESEKLNIELKKILTKYTSKKKIIQISKPTAGPVLTCLKVKNIDQNKPLIIANCDQYLNWKPNLFLNFVKKNNAAGAVLTYKSRNQKNSFVSLKEGKIVDIVEKNVRAGTATFFLLNSMFTMCNPAVALEHAIAYLHFSILQIVLSNFSKLFP